MSSELDIIFEKLREKRHWSDRRDEGDVGEVIPISDQVAGSGIEPSSRPRLTPRTARELLRGSAESQDVAVDVAGGSRRTPEGSYRRKIRLDGPGSGLMTYAQLVDCYEDKIRSALEFLEFLSSLPSEESSSGHGEGSPEGGDGSVFGSISNGECIQHSVAPFKPKESQPAFLVPYETLGLVSPEHFQEAIVYERAERSA